MDAQFQKIRLKHITLNTLKYKLKSNNAYKSSALILDFLWLMT